MLPGIDGLKCAEKSELPALKWALLCSDSHGQEMDKITGLMTGADDYITKPFSVAELMARIMRLPGA